MDDVHRQILPITRPPPRAGLTINVSVVQWEGPRRKGGPDQLLFFDDDDLKNFLGKSAPQRKS